MSLEERDRPGSVDHRFGPGSDMWRAQLQVDCVVSPVYYYVCIESGNSCWRRGKGAILFCQRRAVVGARRNQKGGAKTTRKSPEGLVMASVPAARGSARYLDGPAVWSSLVWSGQVWSRLARRRQGLGLVGWGAQADAAVHHQAPVLGQGGALVSQRCVMCLQAAAVKRPFYQPFTPHNSKCSIDA